MFFILLSELAKRSIPLTMLINEVCKVSCCHFLEYFLGCFKTQVFLHHFNIILNCIFENAMIGFKKIDLSNSIS